MAQKKWEKEDVRLWDHYETPEGFINVVMENVVVTSFFKDKRCYNLFSWVAAPIAGDALTVMRDHIREMDSTFELLESFWALAAAANKNVYLWE